MNDFAAFLLDCSRDDLAKLPVKHMDAEQITLLMQEIDRRNEEDLKRIKQQIKENK